MQRTQRTSAYADSPLTRFPLVLLLAAGSCVGQYGAAGGGAGEGPGGMPPNGSGDGGVGQALVQPGPSPIRRMTHEEYNNTVRDLLGDTSQPASAFPPDEQAFGFHNNASALGVTSLLAEQYLSAAEQLATTAMLNPAGILGCDPASMGESACAQHFVDTFGQRAFRRPLQPAESARFVALYTTGRTAYDFPTAIRMVLQAMLESPHFLYRVEFGVPPQPGQTVVALTPWEMASRLSYFFWNSMPDSTLFAAAGGGQLATKDQVLAQAQRMVADVKARQMVATFHTQWLQLDKIDALKKDATVYPGFTAPLGPLFKQETQTFVDYVTWDGGGDVATLLTAPFTFLNAPLAAYYQLAGPTGNAFQKVMLDGTQRMGILTQAGLLSALAKPNQTSPVHRGKFVREQLLCMQLPPPPANLMIKPPDLDPHLTTRQRFSKHSSDPACSGCHTLMDPIGLGFEHYDGIGQWRATENGLPVDGSGQVNQSDVEGPFDGTVALAQKLATSEQVRSCVATQWFRFAYGRAETTDDAQTLTTLKSQFTTSNGNIKQLLVALSQTDAFLYRVVTVPGGAP